MTLSPGVVVHLMFLWVVRQQIRRLRFRRRRSALSQSLPPLHAHRLCRPRGHRRRHCPPCPFWASRLLGGMVRQLRRQHRLPLLLVVRLVICRASLPCLQALCPRFLIGMTRMLTPGTSFGPAPGLVSSLLGMFFTFIRIDSY